MNWSTVSSPRSRCRRTRATGVRRCNVVPSRPTRRCGGTCGRIGLMESRSQPGWATLGYHDAMVGLLLRAGFAGRRAVRVCNLPEPTGGDGGSAGG
jgi:hypothetical protein